jgi:hypothetical protein
MHYAECSVCATEVECRQEDCIGAPQEHTCDACDTVEVNVSFPAWASAEWTPPEHMPPAVETKEW